MNDSTPLPAPPLDDPDRDDGAAASEFAQALAEYDRGGQTVSTAAANNVVVGMRVQGTVVSVGDTDVLVDFGGRHEAVAETRQFRNEDGTVRVKAGDALELFVVEAGDEIRLAPSIRADAHNALRLVREAKANGVPVSGRVAGLNSGGLDVDLGGVRGFCPMSQIELGFCADPSQYVGRTLEFAVTAVEEGRRGAVLSRRQLLKRAEEEAARERVATLKPGDELEGTVARLEAFGAFVDLGGVDGMVHVSEIRHERTGHPNQVLHEGDRVRVRVLRIDTGKDGRPRIALSIKAAAPDPWSDVAQRFTAGTRIQGRVARLTDFGAFVTVAPGVDGLVHVSEISHQRIQHPKDALKPGQIVEALVQAVDPERKRLSLSIKKTLERPPAPGPESPPAQAPVPPRDEEPTTMALALRKAMEQVEKKQRRTG